MDYVGAIPCGRLVWVGTRLCPDPTRLIYLYSVFCQSLTEGIILWRKHSEAVQFALAGLPNPAGTGLDLAIQAERDCMMFICFLY